MRQVLPSGPAWIAMLALVGGCSESNSGGGDGVGGENGQGTAGTNGSTVTAGGSGVVADGSTSSAGSMNTAGAQNTAGSTNAGGSMGTGGSMNTGGSMTSGTDGGSSGVAYKISNDKKYLVDSQGHPLLIQGEAAWELMQGLSQSDAIGYLDDRKSRGVNALIVELIEHKFTAHTPRPANVAGHVPFTNVNDFTTTHDDYFNDAKWFVQQAAARGMLLFVTPAYLGYGCGDEGWCAEMKANGVAKLTQYGRYVGQKFKDDANIIWLEGGDHTPSASGNPSELDLVNAVANGVIAGDGGAHLHSAHWEDGTSAADVNGLTWLNLDSTYWHAGLHLYTKTLSDTMRDKGVRPAFLVETWYENEHQVSRTQLRSQMYEPLLSGEMGFFVGNDPIWFFGNAGDTNPGWTFGDGAYAGGWKTALNSPATQDATRAAKIFRALSWQTLVPDTAHGIVTAGGTDGSDRCALLASNSDNSLAVAYFTANVSATFDMTKFPAPMKASWLDPSAEASTPVAGSPLANTGSKAFTPPGNNASGGADWVLLLQQ
jgi:hypothetical protein